MKLSDKTRMPNRYNELEIQLDTEPVGLKRSKIVEELSAMRSIEKV